MDRNHQLTISFKAIYVSYYTRMKRFAEAYIMSETDAGNIVQDVFLDLWERQDVLEGRINKTGWLLTSVKKQMCGLPPAQDGRTALGRTVARGIYAYLANEVRVVGSFRR